MADEVHINEHVVRAMDQRNREDIKELKEGQKDINDTLQDIHVTLARVDERVKVQGELLAASDHEERITDLEADVNQAKGVGKVGALIVASSELAQWAMKIFHG